MKLKLIKKQPVADNMIMFWFEPEAPVSYIAGQYIELHLPHENPDERKTRRWFTLSSSPTEKLLAITTRFHKDRVSTFKQKLRSLEIGDEVSILLPMGDFVLPKDESLPLVFVAGGIGITPFRSILKYLTDTKESRQIKLIYAVKNRNETAFEELIKESPAQYIPHIGNISADEILGYAGEISDQIIYLSGPERMVENLQKDLIAKGIDGRQLRTDFFHNYD